MRDHRAPRALGLYAGRDEIHRAGLRATLVYHAPRSCTAHHARVPRTTLVYRAQRALGLYAGRDEIHRARLRTTLVYHAPPAPPRTTAHHRAPRSCTAHHARVPRTTLVYHAL